MEENKLDEQARAAKWKRFFRERKNRERDLLQLDGRLDRNKRRKQLLDDATTPMHASWSVVIQEVARSIAVLDLRKIICSYAEDIKFVFSLELTRLLEEAPWSQAVGQSKGHAFVSNYSIEHFPFRWTIENLLEGSTTPSTPSIRIYLSDTESPSSPWHYLFYSYRFPIHGSIDLKQMLIVHEETFNRQVDSLHHIPNLSNCVMLIVVSPVNTDTFYPTIRSH